MNAAQQHTPSATHTTLSVPPLRQRWLQHLSAAQLPDPQMELNALWRTTGDPLPLLASSTMTPRLAQHLEHLVQRRAQREPLARITNTREFASITFRLNNACLVPRPDSETLLQAVLALATSTYPIRHIRELGCGCGCIILALAVSLEAQAQRPTLKGSDASAQALVAARQNAQAIPNKLPVQFSLRSWSNKKSRAKKSRVKQGKKHLLLFANPPYLRRSERIALSPEVARFDPPLALDGGFDGMQHFRHILRYAQQTLACGGFLALEHAPRQTRLLKSLAQREQFRHIKTFRDLAGHSRVSLLRKHRSQKALA